MRLEDKILYVASLMCFGQAYGTEGTQCRNWQKSLHYRISSLDVVVHSEQTFYNRSDSLWSHIEHTPQRYGRTQRLKFQSPKDFHEKQNFQALK